MPTTTATTRINNKRIRQCVDVKGYHISHWNGFAIPFYVIAILCVVVFIAFFLFYILGLLHYVSYASSSPIKKKKQKKTKNAYTPSTQHDDTALTVTVFEN